MPDAPAILLDALTVRYGSRVGIDGLDMRVPPGSLFGFLGPNGSGKTTTIRAMLGFLRAQSGRAAVFGRDCWRESRQLKRDVGYLPGDLRLYPWMTARSGLGILSGVRGVDLRAAGMRLAERLGLDPDVATRRMSRGMRQKLGLVLTLAHDPRLLILDEPTSGLDPIAQLDLISILRERVSQRGATIFFSSHTLREVEQLCNHVAIVRAGRVVEAAPLEALRSRARRRIALVLSSTEAAASLEMPAGFQVVERIGARVVAEFAGSAALLSRWLAESPAIRDFTVGAPDLEALFHAYYRSTNPEAPP